jgi:hypothetical protein
LKVIYRTTPVRVPSHSKDVSGTAEEPRTVIRRVPGESRIGRAILSVVARGKQGRINAPARVHIGWINRV